VGLGAVVPSAAADDAGDCADRVELATWLRIAAPSRPTALKTLDVTGAGPALNTIPPSPTMPAPKSTTAPTTSQLPAFVGKTDGELVLGGAVVDAVAEVDVLKVVGVTGRLMASTKDDAERVQCFWSQ